MDGVENLLTRILNKAIIATCPEGVISTRSV